MAGVFRKAMVWLGLAPDEEYDDWGYDEPPRPSPPSRAPQPGYGAPQSSPAYGGTPQGPGRPTARPAPRRPVEPEDGMTNQPRPARPSGSVRPLPSRNPVEGGGDRAPTVRPMRPTSAKPTVVSPGSFDDAKDVADRFKAELPVVMDLSGLDKGLARRLIDFSSGICYALGGNMSRVRPGVYLIVPAGVDVSDEERRRLGAGR